VRAPTSPGPGTPRTGAVLAALREALGEDDYGYIVGQLPTGYTALVETAG
jgi:hypothetical protein